MFSVQDTKDNFYFDRTNSMPNDIEFRSAVYRASWNKDNTKIVLLYLSAVLLFSG